MPGDNPLSDDEKLVGAEPDTDPRATLVLEDKFEVVPHSNEPMVVVSLASIDPVIVADVDAILRAGPVCATGFNATVITVAPDTFPSPPTVMFRPGIATPEDATTCWSPIFANAVLVYVPATAGISIVYVTMMLVPEVVENGPTKWSGCGFSEDSDVIVSGSEIVVTEPVPIFIRAEPVLNIAPDGGVSTISSVTVADVDDSVS